jgi:hypothetical protein
MPHNACSHHAFQSAALNIYLLGVNEPFGKILAERSLPSHDDVTSDLFSGWAPARRC